MSSLSDGRPTSDADRMPSAPRTQALGASLGDEFLERYVCWREACGEVRAAYDGWGSSGSADRLGAFAAYRAALDREESAARDYRTIVDQLRLRAAR
jgi:hypothetical protein